MEAFQVAADTELFIKSLGEVPPPEARPALIVVIGLPGTGKSYFCRRLAERIPSVILESDALRKQLFPTPGYSAEESAYLFRSIHRLIDSLLKKGIPIILDATNLEERHREYLYNIAGRRNARLIIVRVEAPPELVRERLLARARGKGAGEFSDADWEIYRRMKPTAEKIARRHFAVDTSRDIAPVIDKIVKEVKRGKK
ncbi:MAG: hypothetical protein A2Z15_02280 [Chloroflexi bacterium RBG_16_50_11]|nr:MAG: hypothetical protein A2Z15_02280 [Chloroflexi bacterium RBG_16_50_11]